MRTSTIAAALVTTAVVASAALRAASPPSVVVLGTVSLTGGTKKIQVAASAITPSSGPEMTGTIVNNTNVKMDDLGVDVQGPSSGPAPTGGDASLGHNDATSTFKTTSASGAPRSNGTTANIDLKANAHSLGTGSQSTLNIDLSSAPPTGLLDVLLTPSVSGVSPTPADHADVLEAFELSGASPGQVKAIRSTHNDRAFAVVTNTDTNGDKLESLSGKVNLRPGETATISSVHLCDLSTNLALAGSSVSVSGRDFTITGFSALAPSSSCYIVIVFTSTPVEGYSIGLDATF